MEITGTYIISQIFTIIMYIFLALTYYVKDRKTIIIFSFISLIANIMEYVFLKAYTGLSMCVVAILRNLYFLIDERKNGKSEKISKKDILVLLIIFGAIIISTFFTYEGFLSLLSVIATMLYSYSVWQKKSKIYKLCGIPVSILWILYNIYVKSLFGVILETLLLICTIIGYTLALKKEKNVS